MAFKKGNNYGNRKGKPKGAKNKVTNEIREKIESALEKAANNKGTELYDHLANEAFKDNRMMIALLNKIVPDLKAIEASIKGDGLTLNVICSQDPKWKKKNTS